MQDQTKAFVHSTSRRSILRGGLVGPGLIGAGLLATSLPSRSFAGDGRLTEGDISILRFLSALEIIETDLWQQYNELGGIQDSEVPGGTGSPLYTAALVTLDGDMPQYIHDNTEDEFSHFTFLNAYLQSKNTPPVNLDKFRTLPSSTATGAQQIKRLTNLMQLTVDTTWWTRYRSRDRNPDFGDTFAPAVPGLLMGQFPAIPRSDADLTPPAHLQAIANTAAFHFGTIEQGGSSLYPSLAQRVTNVEVLRILLSIGPTETMHFQVWHDKADLQANLIMPEPTIFLNRKFPVCSIIRPTETRGAAMGAVNALTADGLFVGQSQAFFTFLHQLANEADEARREI
jgi:hypothetical protein